MSSKQRKFLKKLYKSYQKQHDRANKANEKRYSQILDGYNKRGKVTDAQLRALQQMQTAGYSSMYNQVLGQVDKMGHQERRDIESRYHDASTKGHQDLVSRGFAGTTVLPTMKMGYRREANEQQGRLNDRLAALRATATQSTLGAQLGAQQQIGLARAQATTNNSGAQLGFMERRNDTGPDFSQLATLAQGMGSGGYGGNVQPSYQQLAPQQRSAPRFYGFSSNYGSYFPTYSLYG